MGVFVFFHLSSSIFRAVSIAYMIADTLLYLQACELMNTWHNVHLIHLAPGYIVLQCLVSKPMLTFASNVNETFLLNIIIVLFLGGSEHYTYWWLGEFTSMCQLLE